MFFLQEHLGDEDYTPYRNAIAKLIYEILENIGGRATAGNPELHAEVAARIEKFGSAF
jgi:hypothetical protein